VRCTGALTRNVKRTTSRSQVREGQKVTRFGQASPGKDHQPSRRTSRFAGVPMPDPGLTCGDSCAGTPAACRASAHADDHRRQDHRQAASVAKTGPVSARASPQRAGRLPQGTAADSRAGHAVPQDGHYEATASSDRRIEGLPMTAAPARCNTSSSTPLRLAAARNARAGRSSTGFRSGRPGASSGSCGRAVTACGGHRPAARCHATERPGCRG
jgi:hypothetical protein